MNCGVPLFAWQDVIVTFLALKDNDLLVSNKGLVFNTLQRMIIFLIELAVFVMTGR
jgi:hypothetical protein